LSWADQLSGKWLGFERGFVDWGGVWSCLKGAATWGVVLSLMSCAMWRQGFRMEVGGGWG